MLSGATDWVSDGRTVVRLSNGHPLLGEITGSGCMLGTCVATFCAGASMAAAAARPEGAAEDGRLVRGDMLVGAVAGCVPRVGTAAHETDVSVLLGCLR